MLILPPQLFYNCDYLTKYNTNNTQNTKLSYWISFVYISTLDVFDPSRISFISDNREEFVSSLEDILDGADVNCGGDVSEICDKKLGCGCCGSEGGCSSWGGIWGAEGNGAKFDSVGLASVGLISVTVREWECTRIANIGLNLSLA